MWIQEVADRLVREALKNGGCTLMPGRDGFLFMDDETVWLPPTDGFVVGGLVKAGRFTVDENGVLDDTMTALTRAWVLVNIDEVTPGFGLGSWVDDGDVWLDVVEVLADKEQALLIAKERGELAIFDVEQGESIWVTKEGGA